MRKIYFITLFTVLSFFASSQNAQSLILVHNVAGISQMNAIANPSRGNIVYVIANSTMYQYNGFQWLAVGGASSPSGWGLTGNAGTNPTNNLLGTTDNQDLSIGANNQVKIVVKATNNRLLFPKIIFNPNAGVFNSGVIGIDESTNGRLRITAGDSDTYNNSLGASIDLHGNSAPSPYAGRLDLVAGSGASNFNQGINFYTNNILRASMLGNGNFGINTALPTRLFHIHGTGPNFRYVDGNQGSGKVLTSDANGIASWQTPSGGGGGAGWGLTGNAGTNFNSNFIGTTDNQAITFRVNNIPMWNMAVNGRLESQNSTGNVAIGNSSTFNNNTTGYFNVAIGSNSLESNTTGHDNIAIGLNTLQSTGTSEFNIAIGSQNLRNNTTGDDNVAIGNDVLRNNTTGQENIGIGQNTLVSNTTGFANTAIGVGSMIALTTGQGNTAVGFDTFQTGSDFFFSNAFGGGTVISASQQTRIGFASASIGGPQAWSNTSDARFKENVKQNVKGLDFILGLEPVTYNMNFKKIRKHQLGKVDSILSEERYQKLYEVRQIGFLAQDVEALADSLDFDFHGVDKPENPEGVYGIRYAEFVPSLVKAIQEQQKTIEELVRKVEELQE